MNYKEMDRRFYVSLEVARLLKEKGYDRECISYYHDNCREVDYSFCGERNSTWEGRCVSAPTKAEAIDWLESKGIVIIVDEHYIMHEEDDYYTLYWGYHIIKDNEDVCIYNSSDYKTRLEAKDDAIIKGCELLENGN
jgi:hypothetical protein